MAKWEMKWQKKEITITDSTEENPFTITVIATKTLGKGSFGTVKKLKTAQDRTSLNKQKWVKKTIKIPEKENAQKEALEHFTTEKEILKKNELLYGTQQNTKYVFFMPYLGKSLSKVIKQKNFKAPLTPEDIANIMGDILFDLARIHSLGIIHGDIKLQNIAFSRRTKKTRFIDYGLAHHVGEGVCGGSIRAMAGEVLFNQEPQTQAADVYSTGIVLLEFLEKILDLPEETLVKEKPVRGGKWLDIHEFTEKNLTDALQNKLAMIPAQASPYANLLMRMVCKNPDERPAAEEASKIHQETFASSNITNPKFYAPSQTLNQINLLKEQIKELEQSVNVITAMLTAKRTELSKTEPSSKVIDGINELLNEKPDAQPLETFDSLKKHITEQRTLIEQHAKTINIDAIQKNVISSYQLKQSLIKYQTLKDDITSSLAKIRTNKIKPLKDKYPNTIFEQIFDFIKSLISPFKAVNEYEKYSTATTLTNISDEIKHQVKKMRL